MKKFTLYLLFLLPFICANSQNNRFLFKSVDKNNGLSHNQINSFLKDKNGFLWIGTKEGLSRFDGYSFKNYTFNPTNPASIKNNFVTTLFEDHLGQIWIATGNYFSIFDPTTESFTHKTKLFNERVPVPFGSKWFARFDNNNDIIYANDSSGIFKYIVLQDSVVPIYFPHKHAGKTITYMDTDGQGNIWVACQNGKLYKLYRNNYQVTDSIEIAGNTINSFRFYSDNSNNLWVYDKKTPSGIYLIRNNTKTILHYTGETTVCPLSNNAVTDINEDNEGNIWVSTKDGGLNIIDKNTLALQNLTHNPFNEQSICSNSPSVIYKDYEGIVWVGSMKHGLSFYHKNLFKFYSSKISLKNNKIDGLNDINCFAEDKTGNLWIGTNGGGLVYFNRKENSFKQYIHTASNTGSITANVIRGMRYDKKGRLWIGTSTDGLNLFNGNKFEHFKHNPDNPLSISSDRITDICEDGNGNLWIATLQGGVTLFNPEKKEAIRYYKYTSLADSTIQSNTVYSIIEDRDNILWFATANGLRSFDRSNNKWDYYYHSDKKPNSISINFAFDVFEDSRGFIWIATNYGLNKYNKATKEFSTFTLENGLPSNIVLSITEDNQHTIWFGTPNGLSNLTIHKDPNAKNYSYSFTNYNKYDGLQGNEFNEKAVLKTRTGEIIFGGTNGFNLFDPRTIPATSVTTKIIFTDFQLFNQSIAPKTTINNRVILANSITNTHEIILKYKEKVFSISFTNPVFFQPEQRKYKYTLENFDSGWFETSAMEPKITYTNLNPGKYIFRVIAANNNGNWDSNSETTLIIKILAPWWQHIFLKLAIVLGVILVLFWLYVKKVNKLRLSKNALEQKIKEQTFQLKEVTKILDDKQEEISLQHNEIDRYNNDLEEIISARIQELQETLKKAEESDRLKSAFLANMSHEIRTPMNAIVGFASLLKSNDLNENDRTEFIDIINQNCGSLLVLINDIMDISKIEANQINIIKSPFAVHSILEELENYYKLNNIKHIEFSYERIPGNESVILFSDSIRFRQIISNLLSNAYRFTEKGHVKFGFEIAANEIKFYISDTGIGIKESKFRKIFDHLQKVKEQESLFQGGSGLGLPISKKLVELMGGRIWLESKENVGSTFYFTLPYQPTQKQSQPQAYTKKPVHDLREFTILVAEDEPANYFLIERILKSTYATTIWAKNGKEAVEFISELPEHQNIIVLMDIKMPVMNGIDALKNIRYINKNIPVIAVTAYAYESDKLEILQNDFDGYIIKPLKPDQLLDVIGKFIT